jgi:hypothetical protein
MPARSPAESVAAEIPYLRRELRSVQVEYDSRILDERTVERRAMRVRNGRTAAFPPSLAREGLELVSWPSRIARERLDELVARKPLLTMRQIEFDYWAETIPVIRAHSGARDVLPLHASTVRYSEKAGRDGMMTPAGWAHLDYDADEAAVQLRETLERSEREIAPFGRYVLYQTWRVLSDPPQDFPLAICDWRTVASDDIVPLEYHVGTDGSDVTFRSQGSRHSDRHEWWYFPDLMVDELVLFVGFDSSRPDVPSSLHVSFEDPTVRDPVPRASIETRFFGLFD